MLILNAKATTWVRPLDVVVDVADDAAGPTLDAPLIGEEHPAVVLRTVAISRAAVNALLPLALKTHIVVDDTDMGAGAIDVITIQTKLAFNGCGIEDPGAVRLLDNNAHHPNSRDPIGHHAVVFTCLADYEKVYHRAGAAEVAALKVRAKSTQRCSEVETQWDR